MRRVSSPDGQCTSPAGDCTDRTAAGREAVYIIAGPVGPVWGFAQVMQMVSAASRQRPAWTLLVVFLSGIAIARPAAAAAVSEDVPVPGGTAALAQALGIETTPD